MGFPGNQVGLVAAAARTVTLLLACGGHIADDTLAVRCRGGFVLQQQAARGIATELLASKHRPSPPTCGRAGRTPAADEVFISIAILLVWLLCVLAAGVSGLDPWITRLEAVEAALSPAPGTITA
jgi:hypothetical protein